jgi:hypothetical protein
MGLAIRRRCDETAHMKFADVAAGYLAAPTIRIPEPFVSQTPARRLRDAVEPIATQGWWGKGVHDRLEPLGLGFLEAYIWGRAAFLGEPSPGVVIAAFGVFEPTFLRAMYDHSRSLVSRVEVLAARETGAVESLAQIVPVTDAIVAAGDALLEATHDIDATARPLFAGLRDLAVPESALGRLWRGAELVREHRGDGHLGVCISEGLDPLEMSLLTELWLSFEPGEYSSSRGYSLAAIGSAQDRLSKHGYIEGNTLSAVGEAFRESIEKATDRSQSALIEALGSRLDSVVATTGEVSKALIEARAFPSDPRKRAAG